MRFSRLVTILGRDRNNASRSNESQSCVSFLFRADKSMLLCNCDKKPIHFALVVKKKKKKRERERKKKNAKNFVNFFFFFYFFCYSKVTKSKKNSIWIKKILKRVKAGGKGRASKMTIPYILASVVPCRMEAI